MNITIVNRTNASNCQQLHCCEKWLITGTRREEDLVYEYLNGTDPRQFLMTEDKFGEYFCGKGERQRKSVLFHTQFKKNFVKNGVCQLLIQQKI